MSSLGVPAASFRSRDVARTRPESGVQGLTETRFRALFREERDRTFAYLCRLTGNRADAEDLLQDAFLTVWRKRDQFEGRGSPGGFLRRTAYRLFLNRRERSRRRRELAPAPTPERTEPATVEPVARKEAVDFLLGRVRSHLDDLPDEQRDAFVLFRFEGLCCSDIAELTDTPVKTVESRIRRATRRLAQALAPYEEHLPD